MAAAVPRPNVQHPQRVPLGGLPAVWLCISRIEAGVVNAVDPLRTMDGDPPRRRRFAPSRVGESACVRSFASRLKSVRVATMGFSRKFELCQPYYPVQRFKHVVCGGRSSSHKALGRKRCTGSAVCTEPSIQERGNRTPGAVREDQTNVPAARSRPRWPYPKLAFVPSGVPAGTNARSRCPSRNSPLAGVYKISASFGANRSCGTACR